MSHIVSIRTQVRDVPAIKAACLRLHLPPPLTGTATLFAGEEVTGELVHLPGWRYPLVCDVHTGEVKYDNFEGRWGDAHQLDRFMQAYAVEKTKLEARRRGHAVQEQALGDGSVKLTIEVGGGVS
jgi:hypothetical protein